jgi:hypothetical protein
MDFRKAISDNDLAPFQDLKEEAFWWRPDAFSWSVGDCIAHLNAAFLAYWNGPLNNLTAAPSFLKKVYPFAGFLGQWMQNEMGANSKKRYKTPKLFKAEVFSGEVSAVLHEFQDNHAKLLGKLPELEAFIQQGRKVYSPVSSLFVFPLKNALGIILEHEKRHLKQAQELMKHPDFPKQL